MSQVEHGVLSTEKHVAIQQNGHYCLHRVGVMSLALATVLSTWLTDRTIKVVGYVNFKWIVWRSLLCLSFSGEINACSMAAITINCSTVIITSVICVLFFTGKQRSSY